MEGCFSEGVVVDGSSLSEVGVRVDGVGVGCEGKEGEEEEEEEGGGGEEEGGGSHRCLERVGRVRRLGFGWCGGCVVLCTEEGYGERSGKEEEREGRERETRRESTTTSQLSCSIRFLSLPSSPPFPSLLGSSHTYLDKKTSESSWYS